MLPLYNGTPAEKLRVAFFSDSLSERNGTGAYYHDLMSQLEPRVEALEIFQPRNMDRHPLLSWPMPGDASQRLVCPDLPRIKKAYHGLNPHIVVTITPGPFGLLGHYHARQNGAAFISAFHTDFEHLARIYWKRFSRFFVNGYLRSANRFICKRSATVLVNNSKLKGDLRLLGARSIEVMGTPLEPQFLNTPLKPSSEKISRICFAGRLAAEKNVDQIIGAAGNFPEIEFIIGGDGPLRSELEAQASGMKNVQFRGWMTRQQLIEMVDGSDLLLLPSKIETFGSVALEAMARGRPALVSANAGIHDWDQLQGGLFKQDPEEGVTKALREIVSLPAETLKEKATAARAAAEQLNNETIEQWIKVLQQHAADSLKR